MLRSLLALALACLLAPAFADERAQTRQQLEAARKDINELKQQLQRTAQQRTGAQQELKQAETAIGQLEQDINALQKELDSGEVEIKRLAAEQAVHEQARLEQQRLIGIQARAAYQSGRQEYLKLLLNQQNPEKFSRTLTYYDYLNQARLEQLATFNETLRQLNNIQTEIDRQQAILLVQKSTLDERRSALDQVHQERRLALAKLDKQLGAGTQRLKTREQDQAQLNQVLKTIEETLARQAREAEEARRKAQLAAAAAERARAQAQTQATPRTGQTPAAPMPSGPLVSAGGAFGGPFAQARGKLPWPIDGRVLARYGTARGGDARTKWDGVLIGASAGSQVSAVHGGRVVFADWLRGAGLLVIIDHGNGYLSLYGHNQSLLAKAGDVVKAGQAISTVGTSGGQATPALYFAIRQQGRPADPAQWCRTQG